MSSPYRQKQPLAARVLLPCAALLTCLAAPAARAEIKERLAAVVNGQPITLSEVNEEITPELNRIRASLIGPAEQEKQIKELQKRSLEQLINDKLIEAEVQNLGVTVTEDEIDHQVENLAKQNRMDLATFRQTLTNQGIDFETVREAMRRQSLESRLLQYKVKERQVTDEEVQAAYAAQTSKTEYEFKVRELFIEERDGETAEQLAAAEARFEDVKRRLAAGEEFALVARELSMAPSGREGGDLGWLRPSILFAEAAAALQLLQPGQTTPPVRNSRGIRFFHLDATRPLPAPAFDDVKEQLRNRLRQESVLKERDNVLKGLRRTAQVDVKI